MSNREKLKSVLERIKALGRIDSDSLEKMSLDERKLINQLWKDGLIDDALNLIKNLDTEKEWKALKEKVAPSEKQVVPLWKSVAKYAAIFLGLLAAVYFYRNEEGIGIENKISEESVRLKIGEDAIKLIDEGDVRQLVSASGKVVGEQKGNKISHFKNTEIDELVYNELDIPYGKIFNVELSDGTLVHLNSGSSIRYPIKFLKGQKREVFIDGEAYFKVAKDKEHPFTVNANAIAVEVLGTEFNISSYSEDQEIKTVLVEGSVSLSNSVDPGGSVTLEPGQKAAWNRTDHTTEIEEVDIALYTSWIKGEMIFRNTAFKDMVKKLERRYDVIIYNNNMSLGDKRLNARFNVEVESIEDVLNSINEIQPLEYKITGKQVTID